MPVAIAVWSYTLAPGEPQELVPPNDLVITGIALGDELEDEKSRTTVKLTYLSPVNVEDDSDEDGDEKDDEEDEDEEGDGGGKIEVTVLGSLTPGKIEQASVNVTLERDEEYLLQAVGKNTIHLYGNYIDQSPDNVPYNDDSEPEDEDDFDLRDVSSDAELDPMEIHAMEEDSDDEGDDSHRFEDVTDTPPAKAGEKRARESDASATPSGAHEKKAKKQKNANGEAVPIASPAKDEAKPEKKDKKEKKKEKKEKKEKSDEKSAQSKELPGGLQVKDVKVGEGPQAKPGQKLSMRYVGKLQNGKVFDSNIKGKPFDFVLGSGQVIKGWDQGLKGMQAGGERLLVIPPALAYGKKKMSDIPANSTLTFEVKLLSIK